jgi:hypothetical protein
MKEKSESKEKIVYEKAIQEAISKGILSDYLTRKGDAVVEMLMNQFSGVSLPVINFLKMPAKNFRF